MGVPSFEVFDAMTPKELRILADAFKLKQVDKQRDLHELAYLNFMATATKKDGRPVYRTFDKFYNYDKELEKAKGETPGLDEQREIISKFLYGGE